MAVNALTAPDVQFKSTNEVRLAAVSFLDKLRSGELLTGTPTAAEVGTSDLTLTNVANNSAALTIDGRAVAIAQAVQFKIVGGTASTAYTILVTATSDSSPAQTFKGLVKLFVLPET